MKIIVLTHHNGSTDKTDPLQTHLHPLSILGLHLSSTNSIQILINGFIRYVYIPLFHSLDHKKMVRDLSVLSKKPEEVTFVCEIRGTRAVDMKRSALMISRYIRMIQEGIGSVSLNCYLETSFV